MAHKTIGDFEQRILFALVRLGAEAYGVTIRGEVEKRTGRAISAGLYGVISGVEQRRREIGVRMAVGADRADIMRLIIGRVVIVAVCGIALGVACAVPAMRVLAALLYQVRPDDSLVFSSLARLLLMVALLAGYIPARRATQVDPLTTLRSE